MAEPKHKRRDRDVDDLQPLEASLEGPHAKPDLPERDPDFEPDEYLLLKIVEANGAHLKTMRWGLGLGMLVLLFYVAFGSFISNALGPLGAAIAVFALAGVLLGAGLHALARQLELLRRAVAGCDHFIFGPPEEPKA